MCTKTGFDGYHNADMRKCGFDSLPPCLKDRRDVAVWWPLVVTGFNNTPPYHRSLNMAGATRAMQSILPSRRKNMGSIYEEGITPPTGKAAGLRDYPMLPYNLHHVNGGVFFSQSGASAPVMITAVRGDGVYNRGRWNIRPRYGFWPSFDITPLIPAASKIPCSAFSYRLSEPFYDLRGVMPMG